MIINPSLRAESFISAIACTIGRDSHARKDAEDVTEAAIEARGEGVIYLAGGYWRARPAWTAEGRIAGATLINPDRTPDEIAAVERGIAILCRFEYRRGGEGLEGE